MNTARQKLLIRVAVKAAEKSDSLCHEAKFQQKPADIVALMNRSQRACRMGVAFMKLAGVGT